MKNISVTEWSHADWDMTLVLPDDGSRGKPEDFLNEDQDASLLKQEFHPQMSEQDLDDLPEWDG